MNLYNKTVRKLILATLAGGFGMWIVAGLWHNLIMPTLYKDTHASHEGIGIMLVAYIVLAAIMAYIYPLGYKGGKPVLEGLRFGIIIGILWVFPHELAMAGAHEGKSIIYVFRNAGWHIIEQGIGGIIIGLIHGKR
ncbi:hypothetical protein CEE37_09255 [candidate division LCP-89 bacterium B3_LCP]|uniref:DUF1761 domain-containing protein n=1 Tax=candidate division LCP-89 bacterium B3_LCP TaxID=2012998 RepID=A0A532UZV5_UNCL8|nr:MAG: hypothetical protein CEE37_09255 [candidate division LCP-89 bacterium B3_LCP]